MPDCVSLTSQHSYTVNCSIDSILFPQNSYCYCNCLGICIYSVQFQRQPEFYNIQYVIACLYRFMDILQIILFQNSIDPWSTFSVLSLFFSPATCLVLSQYSHCSIDNSYCYVHCMTTHYVIRTRYNFSTVPATMLTTFVVIEFDLYC